MILRKNLDGTPFRGFASMVGKRQAGT